MLDLMHIDIISMVTMIFGGAPYYVTFIDDHSRKVWDCTLKFKDQTLEKFKHFHSSFGKKTSWKLKCDHSNDSGEYRDLFEEYCTIYGIKLRRQNEKWLSTMKLQRGWGVRLLHLNCN